MTWAVAIVALSLLIIIHEFGHYLAARATGMHVDRFSVLGIGPVILRLGHYRGTEFVISAVPFGAYVHIVGMEPEEDGAQKDRPPPGIGPNEKGFPRDYANFRDRPAWARVLVIAGGPIANYLTAIAIAVAVFSAAGIKAPTSVAIGGFDSGSPAEAAGLLEGDVFVRVAGEDVTGLDPAAKLNAATNANLGHTVDVTVRRGEEEITVPVALNEQAPALNVALRGIGEWVPVAPGEAIVLGVKWPFEQTAIQLGGLWAMITGKMEGRVGGPVAIARAIKTSAERGALDLLLFSALISTVLGMFNLFPLPALDGGRLAFLFYELVARRRVNQTIEGWIHAIGIIGLFGLLGYATIGDIRGPQTPVWKPAAAKIRAGMAKHKAGAAQAEGAAEAPAQATADDAPDE